MHHIGKVTLAVLVLAIALAVYWFWWSDQGANNPIAVEGTLSVSGIPAMPGMQGSQKIDFTLQAVPNKIRIAGSVQGKEVSAIINLSKRELYVLNESKKTYAQEEFDLVDMAKTKPPEKHETWEKNLKRTADWDYIGAGEGRWFCNKQTFTGLPTGQADLTKSIPGMNIPAGPQMDALKKSVKGEMWFTPDTRLGRRYFSTLNKLFRVKPVGRGGSSPLSNIAKSSEKRPQLKYVNLDYFPIPMKLVAGLGPMRIEMNVKNISRKKLPKDVFEAPSNYKKVSMEQVMQ